MTIKEALPGTSTRTRWATFVLLVVLFELAYVQYPLYSHNQNTYFLHGLAEAGFGFLDEDWLAGTASPFLLFNVLVEWTYSFLGETAFHGYHLVLAGVYLYALLGLAVLGLGARGRVAVFVLAAVLIVGHSHGLHTAVGSITGFWRFHHLLWWGAADQFLMGPVFQPNTFGVGLLLSILLFLGGQRTLSLLPLAIAVLFHPSYAFSAALLIATYLILVGAVERDGRGALRLVVASSLFLVPVGLHVVWFNQPSSPAQVERAVEILATYRTPHHSLVGEWFGRRAVAKILVVACALWITRRTPLLPILAITGVATVVLSVAQVLSGSHALALAFPWRFSAVLVPVATALVAGRLALSLCGAAAAWLRDPGRRAVWNACAVLVLLAAGTGVHASWTGARIPASDRRAYPVQDHARERAESGQLYLVPSFGITDPLNGFRLRTGVPVFVDYKSHPFRADEVLEWYRRIRLTEAIYQQDLPADDARRELERLIAHEGITHVIRRQRDEFLDGASGLTRIYDDGFYQILAVR